jgi:hypothetical protein
MRLPKDPEKYKELCKKRSEIMKKIYKEHPEKFRTIGAKGDKNPMKNQEFIKKAIKNRPDMRGEKNPNYGNKWSEKQRQAQRERMIGKYAGEKNPMFGMKGEKAPCFGRTGAKHPLFGKKGKEAANYKTGRTTHNGYILILLPEHPNANKKGYFPEHRLVAEKELKRFLLKEERIHHINGIKNDNRPENLYLFENENEHQVYHQNINYPLISNLINISPTMRNISSEYPC